MAPRETEPEDDPFLFFAARARFASPSRAAGGDRETPPTLPPPPRSLAASADAADAAVRAIDDVPAAFAALELLLETIGANPRRARRTRRRRPGPGPGPGPAVATSPLARGFPPSVGERYATLAVHAIAAARDAETTNISENLRVIARDATDALVDAFLRADDSGSRIARRALLAAADASFAVAAPLLASCARAVRRVVAELDERWLTTRGEGGTEARGERSRDMNVNGPFVSAARLESDSLAREGRLARVFSVADRVARRLVDEPSLEKRSNTARADAKEAFREMTRATAAAERAAEAEEGTRAARRESDASKGRFGWSSRDGRAREARRGARSIGRRTRGEVDERRGRATTHERRHRAGTTRRASRTRENASRRTRENAPMRTRENASMRRQSTSARATGAEFSGFSFLRPRHRVGVDPRWSSRRARVGRGERTRWRRAFVYR